MTADGEIEGRDGLIFGRYRLLEFLGRGRLAEVYRALSVGAAGFKRPVVIKRILPHLAEDEAFIKLFVEEASIAASLDHPNIVQVFDLGQYEKDLFMVVEHVPGTDLGSVGHHLREQGRVLRHDLVAFLAVDVCKALECAHSHHDGEGRPQPVIHRGLSPQNVLLSPAGDVKLADFGLTRSGGLVPATGPGGVEGKLGYVSPEQAGGADTVDGRSDLFSLGVVMYEALTGTRAFPGTDSGDVLERIREVAIAPIDEVSPGLPRHLADLVNRLLSRSKEDRPESAREVRRTLAGYLRSVTPPVDATVLGGLVRELLPDLGQAAPPAAAPEDGSSNQQRSQGEAEPLPDPGVADEVGDTVVDRSPPEDGGYEPGDDDGRDTLVDGDGPLDGEASPPNDASPRSPVFVSRVVNVGEPDEGKGGGA